MKASETSFIKLLEGTRQFKIPIYQRKYSWADKQCKQFFNDIKKVWTDPNITTHFIWWVIYNQEGVSNISEVNELIIIDWQQRLTTIILFMKALADSFMKNWEEKMYNKIINRYLFNIETEWENKFKLYPTKSDKDNFFAILNNTEENLDKQSLLYQNYAFFLDSIEKNIDYIDDIYEWLWKLYVIDIALDRNYDNPQLIFESMNSTGLELSKSDLIRNYILMWNDPEKQRELYEKYWYQMEYIFGDNTEAFDHFFRDYLTFKSPSWTIPTFWSIYESFKNYTIQNKPEITAFLEDIYYFAKIYTKIIWLKKEEDLQISQKLQDIRELRAEVSYPLIMELFSDYLQNIISKQTFLKILALIESYIFRRNICWIPTNSMNKTFATFKKYLNKESDQKYYESFLAHLLLLDSYRRFPRDLEFKENFIVKDVYNYRNRKYLFSKLENYNKKEKISVDNYTIEHIMPQNPNLSQEWKKELWDDRKNIQEKYLHTVWNLTLTWYNPEYSDKSFYEKKTMEWWFDESPLRLNSYLRNVNQWNENTILDRAEKLSELATDIWIFEELDNEIMDTYIEKDSEYDIEDFFEDWMEDIKKLFYDIDSKIRNLDDRIEMSPQKSYIWYKIWNKIVCELNIQKNKIKLSLSRVRPEDLEDPLKKVSYFGYSYEYYKKHISHFEILTGEEVDYAINLIKQTIQKVFDKD